MKLYYLEAPEKLVENALRRARKESLKISQRDKFKREKSKEARRIETFSSYINDTLEKAENQVPTIDDMNPFYKELAEILISIPDLKKSVSQMRSVRKIIEKLKKLYIRKVKSKRQDDKIGKEESRIFFGRAASAVKSLKKSIEFYNSAGQKLRELPSIKFSLPTVILAGYPNTGKSTILSRLTDSNPEIASYPFTTKGILVGHFDGKQGKIQLIDTPGLLDRPINKRNNIEKKAITALKHLANFVVFIADPTQRCGYSLEDQVSLLKEVKKLCPRIIIVINKTDIATKEEIEKAKKLLGNETVKDGVGIESSLKEEIDKQIYLK